MILKIKEFFNRLINKIAYFFCNKPRKNQNEEIIIETEDLPSGSSFVVIRQSLSRIPNRKPIKKQIIKKRYFPTLKEPLEKNNDLPPLSMAKHIMSHRMYNY